MAIDRPAAAAGAGTPGTPNAVTAGAAPEADDAPEPSRGGMVMDKGERTRERDSDRGRVRSLPLWGPPAESGPSAEGGDPAPDASLSEATRTRRPSVLAEPGSANVGVNGELGL
jgi:hypothetical protein